MNEHRFEAFQRAADDALLEEAQSGKRQSSAWKRYGALAACLCVIAAALFAWKPWESAAGKRTVQSANPWQDVTIEDIRALGYQMVLPEGAENIVCSVMDNGEGAPLAQADYTLLGVEYTCRVVKTDCAEDISGLYYTWDEDLTWTVGDAQLQMCTNNESGLVSWYLESEGQQWCVSSNSADAQLLENAKQIALGLGQELATAPEGARDVTISAFSLDGMTVAETAYTLDGIRWQYRTGPGILDLVDISGLENFSVNATGNIQYCEAQLSYDEGGAGKIIWFDIVPGIEYSLSMASGASEEALLGMANELFVPMQGDVG